MVSLLALLVFGLVGFWLGWYWSRDRRLPHHLDPTRATCPACHTSYPFKQLGITKTHPGHHAIVQCPCGKPFKVTFNAKSRPECRSF